MATVTGATPLPTVPPALEPDRAGGSALHRRREWLLGLGMLAPSLAVFGVFIFYPLIRTIWLGFHREDPFGLSSRWVGFDQYRDVITSSSFHNSLKVTAEFALITVPLGLGLGLLLALLAHQRLKGITVFRTIFSSTVATSVAVASLMWFTLFNPSIGVFNKLLDSFGRDPVQWLTDKDTALFAVALTTVWQNLGVTFVILIAGLQSVPEELYESARIDGAGKWSQFKDITLPMLSPTLLFATVVLTINAFQSFGQIDLLTQGGPLEHTNVVVYSIFKQAVQNHNAGVASAQAVVLFLIVLALTVLQFRALERRVFYGD
jgi:ABC-type sugar transport system permease subunit